MKAVRKMSFGRRPKKGTEGPSDLVPKLKQSETLHPRIHTNLAMDLYDRELSHNEVAFEKYGLNAVLDFPNPSNDYDIPDNLKNHMGKNISVPNGEDGNNLTGRILGIKHVYINDNSYEGYLPYYIVLFQADKEHSEAVVKLVYTEKFGIEVLGMMKESEMKALIEKATAAHLDNKESVGMKILEAKAALDNEKKPPRKLFGKKTDKPSIAVNVGAANYSGNDWATMMKQTGKTSVPSELEFGRPSSLSRSSSPTSPVEIIRSSSFGRKGRGKTIRRRRRRTIRRVNKGKKTKRR